MIVSLSIVRNEGWCLQPVIENALRYVEKAVILDHASDDETPAIIEELQATYPDRVYAAHEPDPAWQEMNHRQKTLELGRDVGGTHFVILDADEMLTENLQASIRPMVLNLPPGDVLQLPWVTLWRSMGFFRSDPGSAFSRAFKSMAFADSPDLCWHARGGYHHHHTHPIGSREFRRPIERGEGGWLHFQHASWRRLVAKQTWYQMHELVEYGRINANYRGTMDETGLQTHELPPEWTPPQLAQIEIEREPWQEADMRRMVEQHGPELFAEVLR